MDRSYLDAPTLAALDMALATEQVAESQKEVAANGRLEIAGLLDKLIRISVAYGISLDSRDILAAWKEDVLRHIDTPSHPGWNYCCDLEFRRTKETLEKMINKKVNAGDISTSYKAADAKQWLGTRSLIDSRDSAFDRDLSQLKMDVQTYFCMYYDFKFYEKFEQHVLSAVRSNRKNLETEKCWYRILAVIEYIRVDAQRTYWAEIPAKKRMKEFLKKYRVETVIEKMGLHEAAYQDSSKKRTSSTYGGDHCGLRCTVSSLSHRGRLGIRQIKMRGLTAMREAEDGGYYF